MLLNIQSVTIWWFFYWHCRLQWIQNPHNNIKLCVLGEHCTAQQLLMPPKIPKKYKNSCQGQKLRSNTPTYILLTEPSKVHYQVKLHQHMTRSFQIIDNFLIEKYKNCSNVELQFHQNLIILRVHHNTFLPSCITFWSAVLEFCADRHTDTLVKTSACQRGWPAVYNFL